MKFIVLFFLVLFGCSSLEKSEQEKIRKQNCKGEYILRSAKEQEFVLKIPEKKTPPQYTWRKEEFSHLTKITKDSFRCKGSSEHVAKTMADKKIEDCQGACSHHFPIVQGKEGIYPILIELLNFIQEKSKKKVVITSGHRCPKHHEYLDPSSQDKTAKYMVGAAVDFYVQGMENVPKEVIQLIYTFYKTHPRYREQKEFQKFLAYTGTTDVRTPPTMNKEIFIKVYQKDEGRNGDNRHKYPYISLQVRYDPDLDEKVSYSFEKAQSCYLR